MSACLLLTSVLTGVGMSGGAVLLASFLCREGGIAKVKFTLVFLIWLIWIIGMPALFGFFFVSYEDLLPVSLAYFVGCFGFLFLFYSGCIALVYCWVGILFDKIYKNKEGQK